MEKDCDLITRMLPRYEQRPSDQISALENNKFQCLFEQKLFYSTGPSWTIRRQLQGLQRSCTTRQT